MRIHGLRVLGLSLLAVLGVMAFTAVAAQAEELKGTAGDPWHVLEETITGTKTQNVTGEQVGAGRLLTPGRNLEINCTELDVLEGVLLKEGDAHLTVLYLKCEAFALSPLEPLPCHISGLDITAQALLLLVLHNGEYYVLAEPKVAGGAFTEIVFESGTGCTLPLKTKITGSFVGKISQTKQIEPTIEFNSTIAALFLDQISYGIFPSTLDGTVKTKLTTTNVGCTWGVA